jgi:hypothetical protein
MKVKTSLRCHLIPDRMCIIKKTKNNRCWWGCRGKLSPYILLVGISTSTAMIETSIEVPQKTKNRTTIWCSYTTSGYIPKWIKVRIQWRYLHTLVCCNNIHSSKVVKSINRRMNKENVIHSHSQPTIQHNPYTKNYKETSANWGLGPMFQTYGQMFGY